MMKVRTRTMVLVAMTGLLGLSLATGTASWADNGEPNGHVAVGITDERPIAGHTNDALGQAARFAAERCGVSVSDAVHLAQSADRTGQPTLVCTHADGQQTWFLQDVDVATGNKAAAQSDGYVTLYSQQHSGPVAGFENVRIKAAATEAVRLCGGSTSYREVRAPFRQTDRTGVASNVCSSLWAVQGTRP